MNELICESIRTDIDEVCALFQSVLLNIGFDASAVKIAAFEQCSIETHIDSFDAEECVIGRWLNEQGHQYAHFVRYTNGNLFAEHDVLINHPHKPDLFVEALEVWGISGQLKSEARLLPAL